MVEEIVSLSKSMGLTVDEGDINEFIEDLFKEMTVEELREFVRQSRTRRFCMK